MFKTRSTKLERIDTGDYTPAEYETFMREIAFINRYLGDRRALKKSLLKEIERLWSDEEDNSVVSVLDVGSGSGELLRYIAEFVRGAGRKCSLTGIDLNELSAATTLSRSTDFPEISSIRGDAFRLPFADGSFDYAISSLFFHHLTDEQIPLVLNEMSRVARRGIYIIDLHRHPMAYVLYKLFCFAFRISPLVREDGLLSILRGFKSQELKEKSERPNLSTVRVSEYFPFRLVLRSKTNQS